MDDRIATAIELLIGPGTGAASSPVIDLDPFLADGADAVDRVLAAFLVASAGPRDPRYARAIGILDAPAAGAAGETAVHLRTALDRMAAETPTEPRSAAVAGTAAGAALAEDAADPDALRREAVWAATFPSGVGIVGREAAAIADVRARRTVTISALPDDPIRDPGREVLFTSNVLLTVPAAGTDPATLPYTSTLRAAIARAAAEPQRYWYDHPIQVGVGVAANELLYGLHGLDAAVAAEPDGGLVTCLLSVSVTHDGLAPIARDYVRAELASGGGLAGVDVVIVTETDTARLLDEVLVPALALARGEAAASSAADGLRAVLGVDGEYGRHYSFLKAVAALWFVAVDPRVRATFKFDLDQVFPQETLVSTTGRSAFALLADPRWGATAVADDGRPLELGMVAGALVNERDIGRGLFTPDVPLPGRGPRGDEHLFWSALPQAVSTAAEMMERHDGPDRDGGTSALERIHVTGGTNGIRVDALRRHRPFTPTFVGRAEDQAYILSTVGAAGPRLAYLHAAGLVMRHDKEAFAGDAIAAAHIGKLIGDDVRILVFSAYATAAAGPGADRAAIARLLEPFTGSFVSDIPVSLAHLRLALRALTMVEHGEADDGRRYAVEGTRRLAETMRFTTDVVAVASAVERERAAWAAYYDAIDALETALMVGDDRATELRDRAVAIVDACRIQAAPREPPAGT